jgi:hypothetical protein
MPILTHEMKSLDDNLKNLKPGFVVDVCALEKEKAIYLKNFYNNGIYEIRGPNEDVNNPGKYALAFSIIKSRRSNHA